MLNKEQEKGLKVLESGRNVFLTGKAGSGKSYLIQEFRNRHPEKAILVASSTGVGATVVKGVTAHSLFDIPLNPIGPREYAKKAPQIFKKINVDVIIIDEISMLRFDAFNYIMLSLYHHYHNEYNKKVDWAAKNNPNWKVEFKMPQIIVTGDFFQLSPVITQKDRIILNTLWKTVFLEDDGDDFDDNSRFTYDELFPHLKGIQSIQSIQKNKKEVDLVVNESDIDLIGNGFAFQAPMWAKCHFKVVNLKSSERQKDDVVYGDLLNFVRAGNKGALQYFNRHCKIGATAIENGIYLCGLNKTVDTYNKENLDAINNKEVHYKAKIKGNVKDIQYIDDLVLKEDCRVMLTRNKVDAAGHINGSLGTVVKCNEDAITVEWDDGKVSEVYPTEWISYIPKVVEYDVDGVSHKKLDMKEDGRVTQMPLKVAYAVTIHKSQGQTFDKVLLDPYCFAHGQLYTALSRCTHLDDLELKRPISDNDLVVDDVVRRYYNMIGD